MKRERKQRGKEGNKGCVCTPAGCLQQETLPSACNSAMLASQHSVCQPCLFIALRACVWQTLSALCPTNQSSNLPLLQQTNQSYFTVWQSFILQFDRVKIINHTFTQDVEKLINQSNHLLSQSLCRFAPVLRDSGVVKK